MLHERVVLLTVETHEVPFVDEAERVEVAELGHGLFRVVLRYGFTEDPDIPSGLALAKREGAHVQGRWRRATSWGARR